MSAAMSRQTIPILEARCALLTNFLRKILSGCLEKLASLWILKFWILKCIRFDEWSASFCRGKSDNLRLQNSLATSSSAVDPECVVAYIRGPHGLSPLAIVKILWRPSNVLNPLFFGETSAFPSGFGNKAIARTTDHPWFALEITTSHGQDLCSRNDSVVWRNICGIVPVDKLVCLSIPNRQLPVTC